MNMAKARLKSETRPTGIIRALPYFGASEKDEPGATRKAYRRMRLAFKSLELGDGPIYIALSQRPTKEVLHCYIIVGGQVRVRANIAGYANGNGLDIECWDGTLRKSKWWAVLTAPVSWPTEAVPMRGFQGFRYTEALW